MTELCGRKTRKGTPCQLELVGGKCLTHHCDLSKRNSAVRKSFQANDPKAFKRHQLAAGRAGFKAAYDNDPGKAAHVLAMYRQAHPSTPERIVDEWLFQRGITAGRDVELFGLYVDRMIAPALAIEIDGSGLHGPSAPNAAKRMANDRRKEALLWALGFELIRIPERDVKNGAFKQTLEIILCQSSKPSASPTSEKSTWVTITPQPSA